MYASQKKGLIKISSDSARISFLYIGSWLRRQSTGADTPGAGVLGRVSWLGTFRRNKARFHQPSGHSDSLHVAGGRRTDRRQTAEHSSAYGTLRLIARIFLGGACGLALATSTGISLPFSVLLASIGALVGAFVGYHSRRLVVSKAHVPDFTVAVAEDSIAIAVGLLILCYVGR